MFTLPNFGILEVMHWKERTSLVTWVINHGWIQRFSYPPSRDVLPTQPFPLRFFFNHYSPQASAMKIKHRKTQQIPLLPFKKQKRMMNQPGKWVVLVAAIWIQAFAGTNFDFPSYSSDLKAALGMSQVELNYLAVASDLGKAFGWCSGVALLYFPLWVVMFMAASMGFLGYGLQWLLLQRIISLPYSVVGFHFYLFSPWYCLNKYQNQNHFDLNWINF